MEHKLRGQKHRQNKRRYQDKSKVIENVQETPSTVAPKFVQKLETNWNRYDELPEDIEDEQKQLRASTNFSLLSQAPISQGGHFQFKSDKNMEFKYDFESLRNNKLFSLDLNVLVSSLNTIPFHERCGLDISYLTESQIASFISEAHQNKIQYENLLKIISIVKEEDGQRISGQDSIENHVLSDSTCKVQEVLSKTEESEPQRKIAHDQIVGSITTDQENLEDWLDDILDT